MTYIDYRHFRSADGMDFAHFPMSEDDQYADRIDNMIELTPAEAWLFEFVRVSELERVPHFNIIGYPPDSEPVCFNILSCEVAWELELEYKWRFMRNKE